MTSIRFEQNSSGDSCINFIRQRYSSPQGDKLVHSSLQEKNIVTSHKKPGLDHMHAVYERRSPGNFTSKPVQYSHLEQATGGILRRIHEKGRSKRVIMETKQYDPITFDRLPIWITDELKKLDLHDAMSNGRWLFSIIKDSTKYNSGKLLKCVNANSTEDSEYFMHEALKMYGDQTAAYYHFYGSSVDRIGRFSAFTRNDLNNPYLGLTFEIGENFFASNTPMGRAGVKHLFRVLPEPSDIDLALVFTKTGTDKLIYLSKQEIADGVNAEIAIFKWLTE